MWVRQWEGLSHILWKRTNLWNHQPDYIIMTLVSHDKEPTGPTFCGLLWLISTNQHHFYRYKQNFSWFDRFDQLGLSENVGYIPNYSHLIGIMISKTIGFRGLAYFQTHPVGFPHFFSKKNHQDRGTGPTPSSRSAAPAGAWGYQEDPTRACLGLIAEFPRWGSPSGCVWKCWVNIPNELAIFHRDNDQQNHWVQWGTLFSDKPKFVPQFHPTMWLGLRETLHRKPW